MTKFPYHFIARTWPGSNDSIIKVYGTLQQNRRFPAPRGLQSKTDAKGDCRGRGRKQACPWKSSSQKQRLFRAWNQHSAKPQTLRESLHQGKQECACTFGPMLENGPLAKGPLHSNLCEHLREIDASLVGHIGAFALDGWLSKAQRFGGNVHKHGLSTTPGRQQCKSRPLDVPEFCSPRASFTLPLLLKSQSLS